VKINLGNFGNVGLEVPQQSARGAPAGAFGTGEALSDAGRVVGGVADRMLAEQQAEQRAAERERDAEAKAAAREADRVKSITAQAEAKNALADLHDGIGRGLLDGSLDKSKVGEDFTAQSQKIISKSLAGVSPEHQQLVKASLIDDVGRYQRGVTSLVDQKNRADIGAGMASYIEQMQRYAQRGEGERQEAIANIEAFVSSAGPAAGLDAAKTSATIQNFKEGVTFQYLDNAVTKAQRDGKALGSLAASLDKYPELDPAKRNFLEAKIQRNQQHLATMGEVAERRRLSNLNTMANRLSWYVENGREIPASEFSAFEKGSKGTAFEGFAASITAEQKAVAEFSRMSPVQMQTRVKELAASYGATPTKEQIQHLDKVGKFVQNSIGLMKSAPLEYAAQREGAIVEPLDFGKMDSWASNLANRTAILTEQSRRNGTEPRGLLKQEAAALSGFLAGASDTAKTEALKALRKGFADDKVFRATMQQIAPDSPVTALAGMIATRERPMKISGFFSDETFTPGSTAGLLLAGERLLNPGKDAKGQDGKPTFPMPKDTDIRMEFNAKAGEAFAGSPQAYQLTYQATRAAYAALTAQKGDFSGVLNKPMLKEAIQRATGGIADVNGGVVVTPWGMDQSTFRETARREFGRAVDQAGIPQMKDQWPRLRLQNTKGGYLVKSGTGYLLGKDGNPVLLRVNDPNDPSGLADRIPK